MGYTHRGKRGGKGGNTFARSLKVAHQGDERPAGLKASIPTTPAVITRSHDSARISAAALYDYTDAEETTEDKHLSHDVMVQLVRRSKTSKEHLRMFPQSVETEQINGRQLNKLGPKSMITVAVPVKTSGEAGKHTTEYEIKTLPAPGTLVEVTTNRVVWKSDKTLLRRDRPDTLEDIRFKRVTSRTKVTKTEVERPATIEVPTEQNVEIDDLKF